MTVGVQTVFCIHLLSLNSRCLCFEVCYNAINSNYIVLCLAVFQSGVLFNYFFIVVLTRCLVSFRALNFILGDVINVPLFYRSTKK